MAGIEPSRPTEPSKPEDSSGIERPGDRIGPYRLLEILGEGGFGTVWLAERREPMVQRVALKIVKAGMDTKAVIARFEQERQALAVMDHPSVAKVHDAGMTPAGRPYFVMEYIAGEPITKYCDKQRLTIRQRLELFLPVCEAVQHAHTKGIIHRDLKPANILVTAHEDSPVPKVIDFGVAKAISNAFTDASIYTEMGQIIGTLEYMSPEQAEMQGADVDTRSDVYSLGVVLYELLAGALPFDSARLRRVGYAGIQKFIREIEPPTPSRRVTELADETSTAVAECRRMARGDLAAALRRELDWIPLKALRKDRTERYGSPADLARDIRNYLHGRPLEAGPESAAYRFRKLVGRNRGAFAAAGAVSGALILGIVGFAWQAHRLGVQRDRALAAEEAARSERDRATSIKDYLIETLQSSDPDFDGRQDILLTEAMRRGVERIDAGALDDQPEAKAEILGATASILYSNGDGAEALRLAEQSLEITRRMHPGDHADVARALNTLGPILFSLGRSADAAGTLEEALGMNRRVFGGDDLAVAQSLSSLAFSRHSAGRGAEAEQLASEALGMYRRLGLGDDPAMVTCLSNLANARESLGRAADAERLSAEALEVCERIHESDHPAVATCQFNLARIRHGMGRAAEAEPLLLRALEVRRRTYDGAHPAVIVTLYNLAAVQTDLGRTAEAITNADEAVAMAREHFVTDHPALARAIWRAGCARLAANRAMEARPLLEECLAMGLKAELPGSGRVEEYRASLAKCREALGE